MRELSRLIACFPYRSFALFNHFTDPYLWMFAHSANIGLNNERYCLDPLEIQVQIPIQSLLIPAKVGSLNRFLVPGPTETLLLHLGGPLTFPPPLSSLFPSLHHTVTCRLSMLFILEPMRRDKKRLLEEAICCQFCRNLVLPLSFYLLIKMVE